MDALRRRAIIEGGLEFLQRAVAKRYYAAVTLTISPQFDALRSRPAFRRSPPKPKQAGSAH